MIIIVGGYIVGYPLGGMTWHHLNYLLGLHELGHEVWFLEDSGEYSLPYNPQTQSSTPDSSYGRAYLEQTFSHYGLPLRYCYYSQFEDRHYGIGPTDLNEVLERADLLLCVSGVTPLRPSRPRPRRAAVIDTDPVFTQIRMSREESFANYYRSFDRVATFGRLIGTVHCPLPTHGIHWIGTNQPVCLKHWPVEPIGSSRFTTIGKWEHAADRSVEFAGRRYAAAKSGEWLKMLDLPRYASVPLALAMESMPGRIREQFESNGWICSDAEHATATCQVYQEFIRDSAGEFSVAKQLYSAIPSGWFSDRSACYLAMGRPVVAQSTGFEHWLAAGEGVLAFDDIYTATDALRQAADHIERHALSARALAEQHFDSRKVLRDLLDAVM
jgi:hypothetical protein